MQHGVYNTGPNVDDVVFEGDFAEGSYEVWNAKLKFGAPYHRYRVWGKTCFDVFARYASVTTAPLWTFEARSQAFEEHLAPCVLQFHRVLCV